MIRITAEMRDGGIVTDIQHGSRITGPEIEQEFEDVEYIYGSRPVFIRLEEDNG